MSDIINLGRAIRDPDTGETIVISFEARAVLHQSLGTDAGKLILNSIIPAVAYLQQKVDFDLSGIFSPYMSENQLEPAVVKASDLKMSDDFFDAISFEYARCFLSSSTYQLTFLCTDALQSQETGSIGITV